MTDYSELKERLIAITYSNLKTGEVTSHPLITEAAEALTTLEAEIERLKEGLERIVGGHIPADASHFIPGDWQPAFGALQDIARATLEKKP